ncbi:MAG: iron chelate uptake ABC transporter family permease subunit, partial [Thermoplasmata archaeon]|nr:iron chelate uptake ABC transporter family permease subunit [Thermoplasmata archaeon]
MDGESAVRIAKDRDRSRRRRAAVTAAVLLVMVVVGYFVCISFGSVRVPLEEVWNALTGNARWGYDTIVNNMRAPRVMGAAIAGAALSIGGMAMQALFKNPMAS